ncbi:MAG: hypothetical protein GX973_06570 [Firmicutes bacterium]|nr:hypothetical protein [Bacillota bacterium]
MEKLVKCKYWKEYLGLNGWVMFCSAGAFDQIFTREEAEKIGCTDRQRAKCHHIMESNLGFGLVPGIKEAIVEEAK